MIKIYKTILFILVTMNSFNIVVANENFFDEAREQFNKKKIENSKFLFQRNIVFNPQNAESYLYLAKIFNFEKNIKEEKKNLDTVLLLDPENEKATKMLIDIELKKSNYSKVKILSKNFKIICSKLCGEITRIDEMLKNIEPKNES